MNPILLLCFTVALIEPIDFNINFSLELEPLSINFEPFDIEPINFDFEALENGL